MASLVPCTACRRHVRRHETQCRFCGAELQASSGLLREIVIPRDAKRATVFALSMTLAGQACGGVTEVPIYGAPAVGGTGADSGFGGSGFGGSGGVAGAPNGSGGDGDLQVTPVYGAPVAPETGGSAGSAGIPTPDAGRDDAGGSDAAPDDAGN